MTVLDFIDCIYSHQNNNLTYFMY